MYSVDVGRVALVAATRHAKELVFFVTQPKRHLLRDKPKKATSVTISVRNGADFNPRTTLHQQKG